jgi:hypothetical protein
MEESLDLMNQTRGYSPGGVSRFRDHPVSKSTTTGRSEAGWSLGMVAWILKESTSSAAVYEIRRDEACVRTNVVDSNGNIAWLQPVFIRTP